MRGFETPEFILYSLPNRNYGGHDREAAHKLAQEGKARWAWCHGGVLALVPLAYQLKAGEHFLRRTPPEASRPSGRARRRPIARASRTGTTGPYGRSSRRQRR